MNDDIDIHKLAELARVDLAGTDADALADSIGDILSYVASVEEVAADADGEPEPGPVRNVLREDTDPHEPEAYSDDLLREAPETDADGFVVVPPILS